MTNWRCKTCNARWTEGKFTETCEECGGGAMDAACFLCGGRCGQRVQRAPIDSNDTGVAHWIGACVLPETEQQELRRAAMEILKKRDRTDG